MPACTENKDIFIIIINNLEMLINMPYYILTVR